MQEYPLITIALLGRYTIRQTIEVLNGILAQTYPKLELIISVNDRDTPLDAVIRVLNAHSPGNVKNIKINEAYDQTSEQKHLKYVCDHMSGESLLLLLDGCRFYDTQALHDCIDLYGTQPFLLGTCVMYDADDTYTGDIRRMAADSMTDVLHKICGVRGPVLLPEHFVKSMRFRSVHKYDALENMILQYLYQHEECEIRMCERPMFHCFEKDKQDCTNMVSDHENSCFLEWGGVKWELSRADGKKAARILEDFIRHTEKRADHLKYIEEYSREIAAKGRQSVWGLSTGDRAFLQLLSRIRKIFLQNYFVKYRLKQLAKHIPYRKKIKAVFLVVEKYLWVSCYKSIYDLMTGRQDQYETEVVYVAGRQQKTEWENWTDSDFKVLGADSYDLAVSCPDLVFLCKPYEAETGKWCAREIKFVCPHIIYIPYNMALAGLHDFRKTLMFRQPVHYYAWKSMVWNKEYGRFYDENAFHNTNKLEIGHPKFDVSHKMLSEKEQETIRIIKQRAGGRKVLFWNTSFILGKEHADGGIFLEYGQQFLEYITAGDDFFLLWRPHPLFFQTLKQYGCYAKIMEMINGFSADRLYLDTQISQWPAVFASDLLVSDLSGIIESYLLTNKPIAVTTRGKIEIETHGVFCQTWDLKSLTDFLSGQLKDGDLLSKVREQYVRDNYFRSETRTVAQRLLEVIRQEFLF